MGKAGILFIYSFIMIKFFFHNYVSNGKLKHFVFVRADDEFVSEFIK